MKRKIFLSVLAFGLIVSAFSQNTLELTFTAIDNTVYTQLDSIKVMNRSQGSDRVLVMYNITNIQKDYDESVNFKLFQNYPNPFNGSTTISFELESDCYTDLSIYDLSGKKIRTLVNENKQAGTYELKLDAGWLDKGVYFCVLKTNEGMQTKKILKVE